MERKYNPVERLFSTDKYDKKIALIQGNEKFFSSRISIESCTYIELKRYIEGYAAYLKKRYNIQKGEKVFLLLPFSIDLYITILSLMYIGATIIFVEPWIKRDVFRKIVSGIEANKVIISGKGALIVKAIKLFGKKIEFILPPSEIEKYTSSPVSSEDVEDGKPAVITFTTGSSGIPKSVVRTYGLLRLQYEMLSRYIQDKECVDFISFPNLVLVNLYRFNTTVLPPRNFKGRTPLQKAYFHKLLKETGIKRIFLSVANLYDIADKRIFERIERIYTGGSIVDINFLKNFQILEKTQIFYGSTEIEPISVMEGKHIGTFKERGIVSGKPNSFLDIKIENIEEGIGEINVKFKVKGEGIPAAFIKTGDIGYMNKQGFLVLMGRKIDTFNYRGKWIYPYEILATLQRNNIRNLVIPYISQGKFLLIIEGKRSENLRKIIEDALNSISYYPEKFIFLKKIPRDPRHRTKVDYKALTGILR